MPRASQFLFWSLFALLISNGIPAHAQDEIDMRASTIGATVISNGDAENILPYIKALEDIDINRYRLLDAARILKFESGVEIELISGQDMAARNGVPVPQNLTALADFQNNSGMILQLHSSGRILEKHFKRAVK